METRASYIAVGIFVLAAALGVVSFAFWVGANSLRQDQDLYRILFRGSVTGLQEGSAVRYSGVPVGAVSHIRINPDNIQEIEVTVALEPGTPVVEDNIARLDLQGLAGGVYVLISGGTQNSPRLVASADGAPPIIPSAPAPLERLYTSVPNLIDQADRVLARAEAFLSEDNSRAISETLEGTRQLVAALSDESTGLPRLLASVDGLSMMLADLTSEARVDMARLSDRLDTTLAMADAEIVVVSRDFQAVAADIRQLTETYARIGDQVGTVLTRATPGIEEFTLSGLYEFTLMTSELRGLAQVLSRVTNRFERDPAQFLLGDTSSGVRIE